MPNVRWEHCFGVDAGERERRAALEQRITEWWRTFARKTADLETLFTRKSEWDLAGWMHEHLSSIDPALMWEFGKAVLGKGHRLVITPESRKDLRPFVRRLVSAAPAIDGWEFYTHRLPESLEMANQMVQARCGRDAELTAVAVTPGEHNSVDLTFTGPNVMSDDNEDAFREAFVLTETLIGEELLDKWINVIDVLPELDEAVPLGDMRAAVLAQIEGVRGQLETRPHLEFVDEREWSLLQLKPTQAHDYIKQHDLFVARTPDIELWQATHAPGFYGDRFTCSGEVYCYLKLDGAEGIGDERFADKAEIEDALDDLLRPKGLGCQIGGGTGLRYSYIELALTDVARATAEIRRLLSDGNVPLRSWILFHDCESSSEWIGIYDDSPPPPESELQ